jgi:glycosyltransferase involved in cell wall biosynthesis
VEIAASLKDLGHAVILDIAGDGPERPHFEALAGSLGVSDRVSFHGWIPLPEMHRLYSQAHFVIMPSVAEGWPKVFSEGMAYGAVPIASPVGGVPYIMDRFSLGGHAQVNDIAGFARVISAYLKNEDRWRQESERGIEAAEHFTYGAYLEAVKDLLSLRDDSRADSNLTAGPRPERAGPAS